MASSRAVALITGGARGLGEAFARVLLSRRLAAHVVLADIGDAGPTAERFNREFGRDAALALSCDVTDSRALEATFDRALEWKGHLDIVVNNAGVATDGFDNAAFAVAVNLTAVIEGTRLGVERMRPPKGRGGHIINVASLAGFVPVPFSPVYAATKAGVVHLTRSCGALAGTDKVRVNAICPGFAATEMVTTGLSAGHEGLSFSVAAQGTLMSAEYVAEAFAKMVEEPDMAGETVVVIPRGSWSVPPPKVSSREATRHFKLSTDPVAKL